MNARKSKSLIAIFAILFGLTLYEADCCVLKYYDGNHPEHFESYNRIFESFTFQTSSSYEVDPEIYNKELNETKGYWKNALSRLNQVISHLDQKKAEASAVEVSKATRYFESDVDESDATYYSVFLFQAIAARYAVIYGNGYVENFKSKEKQLRDMAEHCANLASYLSVIAAYPSHVPFFADGFANKCRYTGVKGKMLAWSACATHTAIATVLRHEYNREELNVNDIAGQAKTLGEMAENVCSFFGEVFFDNEKIKNSIYNESEKSYWAKAEFIMQNIGSPSPYTIADLIRGIETPGVYRENVGGAGGSGISGSGADGSDDSDSEK